MSKPILDIDEKFWEEYTKDCQVENVRPNIKDFTIWLQEKDYDYDFIAWPGDEAADVA